MVERIQKNWESHRKLNPNKSSTTASAYIKCVLCLSNPSRSQLIRGHPYPLGVIVTYEYSAAFRTVFHFFDDECQICHWTFSSRTQDFEAKIECLKYNYLLSHQKGQEDASDQHRACPQLPHLPVRIFRNSWIPLIFSVLLLRFRTYSMRPKIFYRQNR